MSNLNIHPIFVHFPVALLTIYGIPELIRFRKVLAQPYWFYIKAAFVIIGAGSAYLALLTGDPAEKLVRTAANHDLINLHSSFGGATAAIFSVLAAGYIIAWADRLKINVWSWLVKIQMVITESKLTPLLALIGLVILLIAGALGGAIVYGHNSADPVNNFIYNLFFK